MITLMFLTHPIKAYGFEYPLVHLEADQSDLSKVSVPFLEGTYALYLAWVQAQIPAIVAEEPVVEEGNKGPVVEEGNKGPVVEEGNKEPVVEEVNEEPVVEEFKEAPIVEEFKEAPIVEEFKTEEPVVEEAAPRKRRS
jgi:hypothetical protein